MLQSILSPLKALALYPVYLFTEAAEFYWTLTRYYTNPVFRRADLRCLFAYLLRDPHKICGRYLRDFPDTQVQKIYGESFFTTLEKIADAVQLSKDDVIYDLGCGRGRSVFWFNAMYQCRAIGVEINPQFVTQARAIKKSTGINDVEFILANVLNLDYEDATVVYLYGTAFSDEAIVKLMERLAGLKPGARVVSVSYPLTHYTVPPLFVLEKKLKGKFLWGQTNIYIQRRL